MSEVGTAIEVGERLAIARNEMGLSQVVLAERVGITRERLAGYEKGRGRFRCGIAFALCRNLLLSERWLATGGGAKNQFRDVESYFPSDSLRESFLECYEPVIKKIYEDELDGVDSLVALIRYNDVHPAAYRQLCFIEASEHARVATDEYSECSFWMDLMEQAFNLGKKYSTSPRLRLVELDKTITILKDGNIVPFSYEKFFDDLALLGLDWIEIEIIARSVADHGKQIPVEELKGIVYSELLELTRDVNWADLYKKIYLWDK